MMSTHGDIVDTLEGKSPPYLYVPYVSLTFRTFGRHKVTVSPFAGDHDLDFV